MSSLKMANSKGQNISEHLKNLVQLVGVKFCICNIVAQKMYNIKYRGDFYQRVPAAARS